MRTSLFGMGLLALSCLAPAFADEPPQKKSSVVMERKLTYAQGLLKALMTDDFDEISRNVKLMQTFTRLEEMYRSKQPGYAEQLEKFQTAVADLSKAAEAKDHDRASQGYVDMVQSCIRCHKLLKQK